MWPKYSATVSRSTTSSEPSSLRSNLCKRPMPHKSPFTDWVADEWDELVLAKGARLSLEVRHRRWFDLYQRTYIDGKWVVGSDDASLVASLGGYLALESEDYRSCRDLLRQFLAHPDLTAEKIFRGHGSLFVLEANADMLCGNVKAGIERLRKPLHAPRRQKHFLNVVRNDLISFVNTVGLEETLDPQIAEFVAEVVAYYRGLKRVSERVADATTYRELNDALLQTFGR